MVLSDLGVPEEDRSCTVLPSPTPPSSCEDTLDDVPHFELHLQDLKPTRSPTPTPPPAPNDVSFNSIEHFHNVGDLAKIKDSH